ncbi:MAG: amidase [Burkholderiaceae bacterium]|jgi:aspartyl-tRNA(Asn)/glutamyl-tRNA(Gln) amidotransferase subunit A
METLAQLTDDLRCGRITSEELTEQALGAARAPEGEGSRAFIALDEEGALAAARAADTLRHAGIELSPLMGIPVSVKDLFDIAGQTTRAGSVVLGNAPPAERDATIVGRLRSAGVVIVGRTNMVEFAYSGLGLNPHYGTPLNPWNRSVGHVPGGSSSGAAVSVTDGMCSAAIGTDTGGSVRIPAALCGLTGFKPTARRIERTGTLPLSTSLDSIGPLAHSVDCCQQIDSLLAQNPLEAPAHLVPQALRLLVPTNIVLDDLDDAVAEAFAESLRRLSRAGAAIVETRVIALDEWAQARHGSASLVTPEAFAWHRELLAEKESAYDPRVARRLLRGASMSAADYIEGIQFRSGWIRRMEQLMAGFDAMILPTVAVTAPPLQPLIDSDELYNAANNLVLRNTSLINYLDGCALSLPCHAPGTAPVGLMVAGCAMSDQAILALGRGLEAVLDDRRRAELAE